MTALDSSLIVSYVVNLAESGKWEDTATDLLAKLEEEAPTTAKQHKSWPRTPRGLSGILRRLAPNLRKAGICVDLPDNPTGGRGRVVTIKKMSGGHRSDRSGPGASSAEKGKPVATVAGNRTSDRSGDHTGDNPGKIGASNGRYGSYGRNPTSSNSSPLAQMLAKYGDKADAAVRRHANDETDYGDGE
jgi:hypothetical protein